MSKTAAHLPNHALALAVVMQKMSSDVSQPAPNPHSRVDDPVKMNREEGMAGSE